MKKIKCKKHPKYKAKKAPKADCPECWAMYFDKLTKKRAKAEEAYE